MVCPTQGGDAPLQGNLGSQFIEMFLSPLTVLPSRLLMLDLRALLAAIAAFCGTYVQIQQCTPCLLNHLDWKARGYPTIPDLGSIIEIMLLAPKTTGCLI